MQLAVFDFDGTSISGNSPVLLVRYLVDRNMLRKSILLRILLWAVAYKFRLPQSETWVRGLVFSAFEGKPQQEVDEFLHAFYDEEIAPRFRKKADAVMRAHMEQDHVVIVISATFEPIVLRAMEHHPFDIQISTRMKVDDEGCYTRLVEGLPVEGEEKRFAVERYADAVYGKGKWRLSFAYGDHHSDRPLLHSAENAYAVTPDKPLKRTALQQGWDILDWN